MIPHEPEELETLAGEYVLGVLDGEAAAEVEAALAGNAELRRAVAFWEEKLHPLADLAAPAEPPAGGWGRIAERLDGPGRAAAPNRLWNSLALWRGATAAAAAAALLMVWVAQRPQPPTPSPSPSLVAMLRGPHQEETAWVAVAGPGGLKLRAVAPEASPSRRVYQLWAIAAGASRPASLGVIGADGRLALARPAVALKDGGSLAISVEPPGGSPTGQPTGPVVFTGKLVATG